MTFKRIFRITLYSICFLAAQNVNAQSQNFSVAGVVLSEDSKPMEGAIVYLYRNKDSGLVRTLLSGKDGSFTFLNVPDGSYYVRASAVGFQALASPKVVVSGSSVRAEDIKMKTAVKSLQQVSVTASRPFLEQKIDRLLINVDASPTNAGTSVWELLEKAPGVSTSGDDGVIGLRGKQGVVVMIDGKPTYLSPADLSNQLKNMASSGIDQVEIMSNPSSQYDAAGNAGIINIKTKRGRNNGLNGTVTLALSAGIFTHNGKTYITPKTNNSFGLNYRKNNANYFFNYTNNIRDGKGEFIFWRKFYDNNGLYIFQNRQQTFQDNEQAAHTIRAGADYSLSKNRVVGVTINSAINSNSFIPVGDTYVYDTNDKLQSYLHSFNTSVSGWNNIGINANYKHPIDSSGKELSIDLDYLHYNNDADQTLIVNAYNSQGTSTADLTLLSALRNTIDVYSFKSDLVIPGRLGKTELGIKTSYVPTNNILAYQRKVGNVLYPDPRSNHFVFSENINAGYFNWNHRLGKWTIQAGLRVENTNIQGRQQSNDSSFTRNYTNIFPTIFISHQFNKNIETSWSFSRRIDRPNYTDLNPFAIFLDSMSSRIGNPFLVPQQTSVAEFSAVIRKKFIITANYNHTTDVIAQVRQQDVIKRITFLTVGNYSSYKNIGVTFTLPFKPVKWWSVVPSGNIYYNRFSGFYSGSNSKQDNIVIDGTAFTTNITNSFNLQNEYLLELSGFYRSAGVNIMRLEGEQFALNLGISKPIFQGRGTLRFNVRNIFDTQTNRTLDSYSNVYIQVKNRQDLRVASLALSWRFGKNTVKPSRTKKNATEDVQNRITL